MVGGNWGRRGRGGECAGMEIGVLGKLTLD